jgi:hypothetical protein
MWMALMSGVNGLCPNLPLRRENRSKGHPRSGGNRLFVPSMALDCAPD